MTLFIAAKIVILAIVRSPRAHRCSGLQSLLPKLASVGTPVSITKGMLVGHCGRLDFEELPKLSLLQIVGGDKIPSTFIFRDQELNGTEQAGGGFDALAVQGRIRITMN